MSDLLKPLASLLLAPISQPWLDELSPSLLHFGAVTKEYGALFLEPIPEEGLGAIGEALELALGKKDLHDDLEVTVVISYRTALTTVSTSVIVPANQILPLLDELEEEEESLRLARLFDDPPNPYNEPPSGVSFADVDPSVATPLKD